MRAKLEAIRNSKGRNGYTPAQMTAMSNIENGIARYEAGAVKFQTIEVSTWHREKLMRLVDDPKRSDEDRELAKEVLNRSPSKLSASEARRLGL